MAENPAYARIPRSVAEALGHAADNDFAIAMSNLLFDREAAVGYGSLTAAERVVFSLDALEREVNNGGFRQYFENSSGDHCLDAPIALRALGAPKFAAMVERALALFPGGQPASDRSERQRQMLTWGPVQESALEALDSEFFTYPEPLAQLERAYVAAHQDAFNAPPRGGQALVPSK